MWSFEFSTSPCVWCELLTTRLEKFDFFSRSATSGVLRETFKQWLELFPLPPLTRLDFCLKTRLFVSLFFPPCYCSKRLLQLAEAEWVELSEFPPETPPPPPPPPLPQHLHRSTSLITLLISSVSSLPPPPSFLPFSPFFPPSLPVFVLISQLSLHLYPPLAAFRPVPLPPPPLLLGDTTSCSSFLFLLSQSPAGCVYWRSSIFFSNSLHLLPHCHLSVFFRDRFAQSSLMKYHSVMTLLPLCNFTWQKICVLFHPGGVKVGCSTFWQVYLLCTRQCFFSIWCLWQSNGLSFISAWRSSCLHVFALSKLILLCTCTPQPPPQAHTDTHTHYYIWSHLQFCKL